MMSAGTVAIVTGGGKGVGAGIARVLCAQGARVCMGYHSSEELARQTLHQIQAAGGEAFLYKADVSDRAQVQAMVAATVERYGRLDALVNNAAMQPNRLLREYDADELRWLWEINIGGYFSALQACLAYLKESKTPRVVNISSVHGKRPTVFDPGYSMTKGAIRMFTREAAIELGQYGITVNCVDLGGCRVEWKTGRFPMHLIWSRRAYHTHGQPIRVETVPEHVGHLVAYLLSPEAGNVTGAGIRLDGGAMLT